MVNTWPLVLMYHGVASEQTGIDLNALGILSQDAFERQLRWLKGHYKILHPDEFVEALSKGMQIPERSVLVTFDDGFQNVLDCALPIAETLSISLLVFICTAHLDQKEWLWFSRWRALRLKQEDMNSLSIQVLSGLPIDEIELRLDRNGAPRRAGSSMVMKHFFDGMASDELAQAVERGSLCVGGHTIRHPILSNEMTDVRNQEIMENKLELEKITGRPVRLFAYPHGAYNQEIAREVYQADYTGAFIADRSIAVFPDDLQAYQIPRTGINREGLAYFRWRVIGAGAWLRSRVRVDWLRGVVS